MKYYCPNHKNNRLQVSPFDNTVFICKTCKIDKIKGQDGIYAKENLDKKLKSMHIEFSEISWIKDDELMQIQAKSRIHREQSLSPQVYNYDLSIFDALEIQDLLKKKLKK